MGMTQQDFAVYLGVALPAVGRYETDRTPKGKVLSTFAELAERYRRPDLAALFRRQFREQFGTWMAEKIVAARQHTITPAAVRQLRALLEGAQRDLDDAEPSPPVLRAKEKLGRASRFVADGR
jgi:transcriptional regulator with XRE-family HTH domain